MVGQRDNFSIDVQGTALDVLANTEQPGGSGFVVVGGVNQLSVLTVGGPTMNAWTKLRSNRMLIRLLKFNPLGTGQFACVSGQFVDIYVLTQSTSQVQRIASFKAQAHKVSDFCWCPFDENLMMSCGENDSVSFWDLRTDLSSPSAQLGLTFGAVQSKFAPHLNNYLLTTNGTDGRLWDLRHTSQPISQFTAHQSKVLCLDWHPHHQEPNTFFTSANDNTLKLWNMNEQKSSPSLISVAPFSAWRLVFSQEGEELAAVSLPPANALALYSNYGLENPRLLKGIAKDAALMDAAWHKSTSVQKSTTKFLYTLSGNHILRRHAIAYELANELRDEMATPITQSKTDEERDRLVAVAAEQHSMSVDPELMQMAGGSLDEVDAAADTKVDAQQQQHRRFPTETRISSSTSRSILVGSLKNASISLGGGVGGTTPQSPIYSEWQHWIRAPNVVGGDLLTELEALRKPTTEGLYTTEVNFTRAAIGFSYMHLNRFPKINFEMRFHREFIENGLVFVEVVQKESPFTADKASLFLTLLQQECDEQLRTPTSQQKTTILCRVLKQLPRIIDMMKVFTASAMEVPNLSKTSSQSGSTGEEQILANLAATEFAPLLGLDSTGAVNRSISAAVPCSYVPSLYDHRVPAPRNCGARFNRSGYLVSFGPNNLIFPGRNNNRLEEMKEGGIPIPRIVPPAKRRTGVSRLGSARSQPSEGKVHHPRSLAEYCVLVNPTAPISLRQTSSTSSAPFQCSPPVRCASPGATWPKPVAADSSMPQDQQQQQQNSLSPPSLLHQNLASLDGAGEMPSMLLLDSSLRGGQGRAFVGAGIRAILGSSPNSASSAVRSYSLQNVAQSIRHRGSSMSGGIASTAAGATANAAEPASATSSVTAAKTSTMTAPFPQHQQSVIESGSTGPAAVMPEQSFNSVVVVYDATTLLPISQTLARAYKLLGPSPLDICRHNFEQAAKVGRKDLMSMWKLVEQCVRCPSAAAAFSRQNGQQSSTGKQIIGQQFAKLFRLEPNRIPRALESTAAFEIPWAVHPLGRELINRLLEYFASKFDLQTAAIITCVISDRDLHHNKVGNRPTHSTADENNDKTARIVQQQQQQQLAVGGNQQQQQQILIASGYAADARPSLPTVQNLPPSRKVSASLSTTATIISTPGIGNRSFIADNFGSSRAKQQQQQQQSTSRTDRLSPAPEHHLNYHSSSSPTPIPRQYPLPQREFGSELLLDPSLSVRFEEVRRKYADILLIWRMYKKCAEVLKHCATNNEENAIGTIKAISWCSFCGQQQRESSKCTRCRRPPIFCAICEQPCNGVVATCTSCSHGGHFMHIAKWFDAQFLCPLGCGCECKF